MPQCVALVMWVCCVVLFMCVCYVVHLCILCCPCVCCVVHVCMLFCPWYKIFAFLIFAHANKPFLSCGATSINTAVCLSVVLSHIFEMAIKNALEWSRIFQKEIQRSLTVQYRVYTQTVGTVEQENRHEHMHCSRLLSGDNNIGLNIEPDIETR